MRTVGDLIKGKHFYSVNSDRSVYDTALYMTEKDIGAVPVLQNDRLVGIFSERDIIRRVIVTGHDPQTTPIGVVMTRGVIVAGESETVHQVLAKMQINRCRHMPVVKDEQLVGFLSLRDLLFADVEEKNEQVQQLQTYIYYSPENPSQ
jgi:CBS domain-containing protein